MRKSTKHFFCVLNPSMRSQKTNVKSCTHREMLRFRCRDQTNGVRPERQQLTRKKRMYPSSGTCSTDKKRLAQEAQTFESPQDKR